MMKNARVSEIKSTLGNDAYDRVTVKLEGENGFVVTVHFRTNEKTRLAFDLGEVYRLGFAPQEPQKPEPAA